MQLNLQALPLLTLRLRASFERCAPAGEHAAELWRGAVKGALQRHAPGALDNLASPERTARTAHPSGLPSNQTTPGYTLRVLPVAPAVEAGAPADASVADAREQWLQLTFFGDASDHSLAILYGLMRDGTGPGVGGRALRFSMQELRAYAPASGWYDLRLPVRASDLRAHRWTHVFEPTPDLQRAQTFLVGLRFTSRLVFEVSDVPLAEAPSLYQLTVSLGARCNRLAQVWGQGPIADADTLAQLNAAAAQACIDPDTHIHSAQRRMSSGRQASHYPSNGTRGLLLYRLPAAAARDLLPLLELGQWTHVGAHSTAGQGHYELLTGTS